MAPSDVYPGTEEWRSRAAGFANSDPFEEIMKVALVDKHSALLGGIPGSIHTHCSSHTPAASAPPLSLDELEDESVASIYT